MDIQPQLLDILRCTLDPTRTARLEPSPAGDALVCQRCRLEYPVRDGIPCMLPEEAKLPPSCDGLAKLPCQQPTQGGPSS